MRTWQTIARWSPTSNYLILTIGIFLQPPLQGKLPLSGPGTSRTFQQGTSSLPRDQPVTGRFLTDLHAAFPEALVLVSNARGIICARRHHRLKPLLMHFSKAD